VQKSDMNLHTESKTVIITGANGNLGTAVVNLFLHRGYRIIATVRNKKDEDRLPVHENLHVHTVDLSIEEEAVAFVLASIELYKKIDGALLLAGGFAPGDLSATSGNDIKKQVSLNFETAYHIAHPLLPHLLGNGYGRLIFIGARPALEPAAGMHSVAYGLSKSLLFKLAEYINRQTKGKNITATVVVPSTLDTLPNRESMPGADPSAWVKPEALAEILEFICSGKASALRETVLKVYNNA
jgi:NAD(P)-dependent dehydrogenase (short-subunit alcohol dehydrogenase family)